MRILVVEDEAIVGRDIQASLTRCGHTVDAVLRTGESAIEYLRSGQKPDLVVMDIRLGGKMDGIEAGAMARQDHGVPVLFLSVMSDSATLRRANDAGAYGYLLKPFNERELHSTVEIAAGRHASEKKLAAQNARHLGTLTSMANAVLATDLIGRVTFLNPAAEAITGWSADEAHGRFIHEVFRISHSSGEAVAAGEDPDGHARSVLLTTRAGALIQIEDNTTPLRDSDGGLRGLVVVFRSHDDTDAASSPALEETDDELATWAQLAGMVRGIADPMISVDPQWKITYVNEPAASLLGTPRRELFGADFWAQVPKSAHSRHYQKLHQALSRNEPAEFELQLVARALWFQARCHPFANGLLILLTDITARKTADEQQAKLDKLESLGYLARGFAHDFNNLLTVLLGNLSIAGMRAPDDAPYRVEIDEAKRATLQAQALVQQLLVFAKGGAPIRRRTAVHAFVEQWFKGHRRRQGISYKLDIDDDIGFAEMDPGQIRRVLSNLVANSELAIADTGTIEMIARRVAASDPSTEAAEGVGGPWIEWTVKDTGHGIAPEDLKHVFEPYFSTRQHANASGIGLTVCESIVNAHNGAISVDSEQDQGTVVTVRLPAATDPSDAAPPPSPGAVVPKSTTAIKSPTRVVEPPRQLRILILEDERLIRQLLAMNLKTGGYAVEAMEEGSEAVAAFRKAHDSGEGFDLFITDLTIPDGMGGAQAMEQILAIDPDVRAIVSSGYSDDPVMAHHADYGFSAVLPKPYEPRQLLELVKEVVSRP